MLAAIGGFFSKPPLDIHGRGETYSFDITQNRGGSLRGGWFKIFGAGAVHAPGFDDTLESNPKGSTKYRA